MAFSATDMIAVERAIATGVLRVQFADGRRVEYNSVPDLMRARDLIRNELAMESATPPARLRRVVHVRT